VFPLSLLSEESQQKEKRPFSFQGKIPFLPRDGKEVLAVIKEGFYRRGEEVRKEGKLLARFSPQTLWRHLEKGLFQGKKTSFLHRKRDCSILRPAFTGGFINVRKHREKGLRKYKILGELTGKKNPAGAEGEKGEVIIILPIAIILGKGSHGHGFLRKKRRRLCPSK